MIRISYNIHYTRPCSYKSNIVWKQLLIISKVTNQAVMVLMSLKFRRGIKYASHFNYAQAF